jgi:hypothetical protein
MWPITNTWTYYHFFQEEDGKPGIFCPPEFSEEIQICKKNGIFYVSAQRKTKPNTKL